MNPLKATIRDCQKKQEPMPYVLHRLNDGVTDKRVARHRSA
jgi:hypothetical protein